MFIELDNLIIPTFRKISDDIIKCKVDRAILKGGRSSTKSQVAATDIIIGVMSYRQSAVCLVKYSNKIEERLVNTFMSAIGYLGVGQWWKLRKSPYELVLLNQLGKETNTSIKFTGCDNADSLKSYRPRAGSFRYVWFEELTNFSSVKEVNNIIQSMVRGEGDHTVIMSYNPPIRSSDWVNSEYDVPCGLVLGHKSNEYTEEVTYEVDDEIIKSVQTVHHSTYLDVIEAGHKNWLGNAFISAAKQAEKENIEYYKWAYLGEIVGTNSNVFHNIKDWNYDGSIINNVNRGLDCSNGGQDPWQYCDWYYDKKNRCIYCLNEFRLSGEASFELVSENIRKVNKNNYEVYIDSAVPTFRRVLMKEGLNILPAKKGNDSVKAGIKWLQSLNGIYIDKYRCPVTYKEFKQYEYLIDKDDNVTSELVDENNHSIDACRYALCNNIRYDV